MYFPHLSYKVGENRYKRFLYSAVHPTFVKNGIGKTYLLTDVTVGNFRRALIYDIFVSCNWVDTRWQQYSTHLHTNSIQNNRMKQNTQNGTYITIRIHNIQN
jgi:hypothetical protein